MNIKENDIGVELNRPPLRLLQSTNPVTKKILPDQFAVATEAEINQAASSANTAWKIFRETSGSDKAKLLRTIADEIVGLGSLLINKAMEESGLPEGRIIGERGRTCNQLKLFADYVEEGSWVDAMIDKAQPNREPMPRADIRKYSIALGPVAVFTASNFPLAFSTAGGDTASALAAGCPVIVKAHPSHLGTNALVAQAISRAVAKCKLPEGIFSSLNGGIATGQALVNHPLIKAVGFTGSHNGGKAIFNIANARPEPIPVYAEMGSNNPIFILPQILKSSTGKLAATIASSVNLGAGQFCTNPGILVLEKNEDSATFLSELRNAFSQLSPSTMLNENIYKAYESNRLNCLNSEGVKSEFTAASATKDWVGIPSFASISAHDFLANKKLQEEIFGPFTLVVLCNTSAEMIEVATNLPGQLTATLMGTDAELSSAQELFHELSEKAGRLLFNGVPTGVEVCAAMHHGGPFPSTSNPLFTSVGTDAIKRFVRPVTFQNAPESLLPPALKSNNPLNIWRTINGKKSKE